MKTTTKFRFDDLPRGVREALCELGEGRDPSHLLGDERSPPWVARALGVVSLAAAIFFGQHVVAESFGVVEWFGFVPFAICVTAFLVFASEAVLELGFGTPYRRGWFLTTRGLFDLRQPGQVSIIALDQLALPSLTDVMDTNGRYIKCTLRIDTNLAFPGAFQSFTYDFFTPESGRAQLKKLGPALRSKQAPGDDAVTAWQRAGQPLDLGDRGGPRARPLPRAVVVTRWAVVLVLIVGAVVGVKKLSTAHCESLPQMASRRCG